MIRYSRPATADAASTSLSPLGEGSSPDGAATPAPGPSDDPERVAEATEPEGSTDSADRGATPDTDEGPPRDTRTRRRRGGTDGDGAPACIGKESSAGGVAAPPMDSATSTEPFCAGDVFALGVDPNALLCGGATAPSGTGRSITGGEPGVGPAEALACCEAVGSGSVPRRQRGADEELPSAVGGVCGGAAVPPGTGRSITGGGELGHPSNEALNLRQRSYLINATNKLLTYYVLISVLYFFKQLFY